MAYRVLAPLVLAKTQEGEIRYHYRNVHTMGKPANYGDIIPWLSDEQAEMLISEGAVELIEDPVEENEPKPAVDPEALKSCLKALEGRDVELSAGRPTCLAALRDGGHRFSNDVVAAAVKARKDAERLLVESS
jgi:hypothetical protein